MTPPSDNGVPQHAMVATSFAESLARRYADQVSGEGEMLAAFAGLVAVRDRQLAADCLTALESALSSRASAGSGEPSV